MLYTYYSELLTCERQNQGYYEIKLQLSATVPERKVRPAKWFPSFILMKIVRFTADQAQEQTDNCAL